MPALCARAQNQRHKADKRTDQWLVSYRAPPYMLKSSEASSNRARAMVLASGLCGQHVQNIINALLCSGTVGRYSMQQVAAQGAAVSSTDTVDESVRPGTPLPAG